MRGLPKDGNSLYLRPDIVALLEKGDIVCMQDTWYSKQDLDILNNLHPNFSGTGVSTTYYQDGLVRGHPPGGVAILWRKNLDLVIKPIDLKYNWCTAIEINTGSNTVVVISVYLPYQSPNNEVEYLEKLGYINAVTNDLDTTCFVIVGDWNANIRNGGASTFARHMSQLCMDNSYILSSQALLPTDSYTHVSEAWGSVSWLDHIVSSADVHHCIQTVSIDYDISDVDHIPVLMDLSLDDIPETSVSNHVSYRRLAWDKLTADDRANYLEVSHDLLSRIEIPDAVHCTDVNCCDASHINATHLFYEQTMRSLIQASDTVFSNPSAYKGTSQEEY